jgi:hypothetical protein
MDNRIEEICKIAYSFKDTVYSTYSFAKQLILDNVTGCFVECGVAGGAQIAAMKLAIQDASSNRSIYGFDSFVGIPLAGEKDDEQPGLGKIDHDQTLPLKDRLVSSGITVHSKDNVEAHFRRFGISMENVFLVEGWFQDTLPGIQNKIGDIALLRLDGDLYESTMVCLDNLYDNVVTDGIVIIDDYSTLSGARKAVHEFFEKKEITHELFTVPDSGGVKWFIK